jgi:beta-glucosidase
LYVRDLVGSVTRPVKELKGFQRVALQPGAFAVWIGPNSAEGLEGRFEVR